MAQGRAGRREYMSVDVPFRSRGYEVRALGGFLGLVLLLTGCGKGSSPAAGLPATTPSASDAGSAPHVDPTALGEGRLAVVWDGKLHVLDAGTRQDATIEASTPSSPVWSSDGTWLAFLETTDPAQGTKRARVWPIGPNEVSPDGKPVAVAGLPERVWQIAWSPSGNTLAALAAETPDASPSLWVSDLDTPARRVATAPGGIFSFAWRPYGSAIAYTAGGKDGNGDALVVLPLDGGTAAPELDPDPRGDGILVAGWWPDGKGILYWPDPQHSSSIAADGLTLRSLAVGSHTPRDLTQTLVYRDWLSWAPDGRRLLTVAGNGREAWGNKTLTVCDIETVRCTAIPNAPGTVALDPAWSPKGGRIAFVRAADASNGGMDWQAWTRTRSLWTAAPDGKGAERVPAGSESALEPVWDRAGERLLFTAEAALHVKGPDGVATVAQPFPGSGNPVTDGSAFFYGHLPVDDLLDWWP